MYWLQYSYNVLYQWECFCLQCSSGHGPDPDNRAPEDHTGLRFQHGGGPLIWGHGHWGGPVRSPSLSQMVFILVFYPQKWSSQDWNRCVDANVVQYALSNMDDILPNLIEYVGKEIKKFILKSSWDYNWYPKWTKFCSTQNLD